MASGNPVGVELRRAESGSSHLASSGLRVAALMKAEGGSFWLEVFVCNHVTFPKSRGAEEAADSF